VALTAILSCWQYTSSFVLSEVWFLGELKSVELEVLFTPFSCPTPSSRLGHEASLLSDFPDVSKGM
jgi:hypothetical protein